MTNEQKCKKQNNNRLMKMAGFSKNMKKKKTKYQIVTFNEQ